MIQTRFNAVYCQCARALMHSRLWDPTAHVGSGEVPTAGQMTRGVDPEFDTVSYDAVLAERQKSTFY